MEEAKTYHQTAAAAEAGGQKVSHNNPRPEGKKQIKFSPPPAPEQWTTC